MLVSAFLVPLLVQLPYPLLRIPLGLYVVLWVPGYVFTATLFVRSDELRPVERAAASIGLSAAILPLLALLLDRLPWGIEVWPMVIALAGWIVVCAVIAFIRRRLLIRHDNSAAVFGLAEMQRRRFGRLLRPLPILMSIGVLAGIFGLSSLLDQRAEASLTEFYVLGESSMAEDYPQSAIVNQPITITLGVINRELLARKYRIVGYSSPTRVTTSERKQILVVEPFDVVPGSTYQTTVSWPMPRVGPDQYVEFVLLVNGDERPYRNLRLSVSVAPPPSEP